VGAIAEGTEGVSPSLAGVGSGDFPFLCRNSAFWCTFDIKATFDSVDRDALWKAWQLRRHHLF